VIELPDLQGRSAVPAGPCFLSPRAAIANHVPGICCTCLHRTRAKRAIQATSREVALGRELPVFGKRQVTRQPAFSEMFDGPERKGAGAAMPDTLPNSSHDLNVAAIYALELPVAFEGGSGVTRHISREEVRFRTAVALVPGQPLKGVLTFPDGGPEWGTAVRFLAEVVDVEPEASRGNDLVVTARFEELEFMPPETV
jgi:hypothetical protein